MSNSISSLEDIYILSFESSCDETGVAIYNGARGLIANQLFSQIDLHAVYGGVVPELASRDHIKRVQTLLDAALEQAGIELNQVTAIAGTVGPGLIGALLVGAMYAKTLAYSLNIPFIEVNHLEGHLLAPFLEQDHPSFPFLGVLISGGHSQFVYVESYQNYKILGSSIDDAVGEAFDKTAKMLGLPYPGGRLLSELATEGKPEFEFTAPMINRPGVDLSFSGLKTSALNKINEFKKLNSNNLNNSDNTDLTQDIELTHQQKADIAKAFENCIVRTFTIKIKRCLDMLLNAYKAKHPQQASANSETRNKSTSIKHASKVSIDPILADFAMDKRVRDIVLVGGVSANKTLRAELATELQSYRVNLKYARPEFCVDNGAMIAIAGFYKFLKLYQPELLTTLVKHPPIPQTPVQNHKPIPANLTQPLSATSINWFAGKLVEKNKILAR